MSWPADAEPPRARRGRRQDDYLRGLAALDRQGSPDARRADDAPHADATSQPAYRGSVEQADARPTPGRQAPFAQRPETTAGPQPFGGHDDPLALATRRADDRRVVRIRRRGPLVALILPAVLAAGSFASLRGDPTAARGVGGFVLALMAAPALPAAGVPVTSGGGPVLAAVLASALLWMLIGWWAARRTTRPTWGRWWGEYLALAAGAWAGGVAALAVAQVVLTGTVG